jgi:hypothetical protein
VAFPIDRASYRTLDPDFTGQVFVADIDRTYLSTRFSSLRGMARIPFERAAQKQDIEGMARLFREIRRGPDDRSRDAPLYFLSASPKQLRPVIERKMGLDGIVCDGTTFKDWGRVLRRAKFKRLREQVGFKLTALLAGRAAMPEGAIEILLGDDLEKDPVTYAIYADTLADRIPLSDLPRILRLNGVLPGDAEDITKQRRDLRPGRGVLRALIRLERHLATDDFIDFGPGVIGCTGAFQMASVLWKLGSISLAGVGRVAAELAARGIKAETIAERLEDLARRALLTADEMQQVAERLRYHGLLEREPTTTGPDPRWERIASRGTDRVWTPAKFLGE